MKESAPQTDEELLYQSSIRSKMKSQNEQLYATYRCTRHSTVGKSIPDNDSHACSVSLPNYSDVIGYEEGCPKIIQAMTIGYPRFRYHNDVRMLMHLLVAQEYFESACSDDQTRALIVGAVPESMANSNFAHRRFDGDLIHTCKLVDVTSFECMVLPNRAVAERFCKFMLYSETSARLKIHRVVPSLNLHAVFFDKHMKAKAKSYWQHSGEITSSRTALQALAFYLQYSSLEILRLPAADESSTDDAAACCLLAVSLRQDCGGSAEFTRLLGNPLHRRSGLHDSGIDGDGEGEGEGDGEGGDVIEPGLQVVLSTIKQRIARIVYYPTIPSTVDNIVLTVTGMSAIFTAFRAATIYHSNLLEQQSQLPLPPTTPARSPPDFVVFGFPYLDTLKISKRPEWNEGQTHFFQNGDEADLEALAVLLEQGRLPSSSEPLNKIAAVFTEFPSNPLLKCHNLKRLSELAAEFGCLLVVDDTIANFANAALLRAPGLRVDMLCSSLTKTFSGKGNVMAGSVLLNTELGERSASLRRIFDGLQACHDLPALSLQDAVVLEENSRDFLWRSNRINKTALRLASYLRDHEAVQTVHFPAFSTSVALPFRFENAWLPPIADVELDANGAAVQHVAGFGCLFSLVLKEGCNVETFFDHLNVRKGPSLGTCYTLACPYTVLAHYDELAWAAACGVSASLIRVSVGLEDAEDLIQVFDRALQQAAGKSEDGSSSTAPS